MQIIELRRLDREGRAVEKVPGVRITSTGLVFERALNVEQPPRGSCLGLHSREWPDTQLPTPRPHPAAALSQTSYL